MGKQNRQVFAAFFYTYKILWRIVQPFLYLFPRLRLGWQQRTLADDISESSSFAIWIQAASGGEAMLANMVLDMLSQTLPKNCQIRILATSGTSQGIEMLEKGKGRFETNRIRLSIRYFPFDNPANMERAFAQFSPKLTILVETELWPGFLVTAKRYNTPVMVINGRMSAKSYQSYYKMRSFFDHFAPDLVLAMSEEDGNRYANLIGEERVTIIPNLKFDRIIAHSVIQSADKRQFHAEACKYIVFGSIRKEEEHDICQCAATLLTKKSAQSQPLVVAIFPKHLQRVEALCKELHHRGVPYILRSKITSTVQNNSVIVWDTFGELASAYALADTAFVGGSLCTWGGHNFLEPLSYGVRPIIGRHWHNFAWIGRWIIDSGFVYEIADETELLAQINKNLAADNDTNTIINEIKRAIKPFQGGTALTCRYIVQRLQEEL